MTFSSKLVQQSGRKINLFSAHSATAAQLRPENAQPSVDLHQEKHQLGAINGVSFKVNSINWSQVFELFFDTFSKKKLA